MTVLHLIPFDEAVAEVSAGNAKIQRSDYLPDGMFPIVDQGQELIGGYSNSIANVVRGEGPWIIFGDHTRILKFIDFPFCLGADGVKLLKPRSIDLIDPRFLYHFLLANPVASAGYSRHYKFMKEMHIPLMPLEEQRRIVAVLDKIEAICNLRKRTIALISPLVQSMFAKVFSDLNSLPFVPLGELLNEPLSNGVSPSSQGTLPNRVLTLDAVTSGSFYKERTKIGLYKVSPPLPKLVRRGDLLVARGNGNLNLVGRGALVTGEVDHLVYPDTIISVRANNSLIDPIFLSFVWGHSIVRQQIEQAAKTTNGIFKINQNILELTGIPLPNLERQRSASQFVGKSSKMRFDCEKCSHTAAILRAALHKKYFGELQ